MELSREDVDYILKLLDASDFDYLEVKFGDVRIVASKSGAGITLDPIATESDLEPSATSPETLGAPVAGPGEEDSSLTPLKSPIVGIFYSRPDPGAAPYVTVGATIEPGMTVGVIEVMKVFTSVTAQVYGVIAHVLVQDGEAVEYGQPLFLVHERPE